MAEVNATCAASTSAITVSRISGLGDDPQKRLIAPELQSCRLLRALRLDLVNPCPQPILERCLKPRLIVFVFQVLDRFSYISQANVMTGHGLGLMFRGDESKQVTLVAGMGPVGITIIDAGHGVLEG